VCERVNVCLCVLKNQTVRLLYRTIRTCTRATHRGHVWPRDWPTDRGLEASTARGCRSGEARSRSRCGESGKACARDVAERRGSDCCCCCCCCCGGGGGASARGCSGEPCVVRRVSSLCAVEEDWESAVGDVAAPAPVEVAPVQTPFIFAIACRSTASRCSHVNSCNDRACASVSVSGVREELRGCCHSVPGRASPKCPAWRKCLRAAQPPQSLKRQSLQSFSSLRTS
jgi:hypothetical protein